MVHNDRSHKTVGRRREIKPSKQRKQTKKGTFKLMGRSEHDMEKTVEGCSGQRRKDVKVEKTTKKGEKRRTVQKEYRATAR